jgi:PIN domain nuclease of toxin-antitoxin system
MRLRLPLDTHVPVHMVLESKRLSREQTRVLKAAVQRRERLAVSPVSLVEVAILHSQGKVRLRGTLSGFFEQLRSGPELQLIPLSEEIAVEVALLTALRDPPDKAIAATARVHGLTLVTSDQRIIDSQLVRVVE